jgi:hypothetical protein
MKRLIVITCSFLVFFAGVASAWASCKQISFAVGANHRSSVLVASHPDHRDSHHEHSDGAGFHCPPLEKFVPTAAFSAKPDRDEKRAIDAFETKLASQFNNRRFHRLLGLSALARSNGVASHLFFSVLLI